MSSPRMPRMDGDGLFKTQKNLMRISGDHPHFQVVFELGIIIMAVVCFLSYRQIRSYTAFVAKIAQVDEIRSSLLQANLHLREAEASEKGFIQSGHDSFVDSYNLAQARFSADLNEADRQARRSGLQIPQNAEIKKIAAQKFTDMNETMKTRVIGDIAGAQSRMVASASADVSELQTLLEKVDISLFEELKQQRELLETAGSHVTWVILMGTALALLLLLMWRNLSSQEKKKLEGLTIMLSSKQSELVEAQNKADEADKIKTDFLNNMSHEIRTPLNAIFGLGQLLSRTRMNSDQSHYLQGIQGSAKSLLELVNGVLDFAKIENHGMDILLQPVRISELMKEIKDILQGQAELKGLELRVNNHLPAEFVISDATRLRQVVLNLAGNALKFTQAGFVEIRVSQSAEHSDGRIGVRFDVIDSGIGIPKDSQEKIFQNFYQTDSSISRKFGGTGLGLAISKAIVSKMEGGIGFKSEDGVGSQFWFDVPMQKATESDFPAAGGASALREEAEGLVALRKLKTLIIEDNHLNQVVLSGFLRQLGCEVHVCSGGREALAYLESANVQVIFLDCQMPEMDGFQVAEGIRTIETKRKASWKIVASTAHTTQGYKEKCLRAGMNEFLPKPIIIEDLADLLLRLTSDHSAETEPIKNLVKAPKSQPKELLQLDKKRWEKLKKVTSGSGNFLQEIAQIFIQIFPDKVKELDHAFKIQDLKAVEDIAHYLKSSCADIGAMLMSDLCNQIETIAEEQKGTEHLGGIITQLKDEYHHIEADIRAVA